MTMAGCGCSLQKEKFLNCAICPHWFDFHKSDLFFATLFSRMWANHQEWALWSNPISRLSSPIRTQPALYMDHRGPAWKHHQVWTAFVQLFPPSFVFFSQTLFDSTSFSRTFRLACFLVHFFTMEVNGFTIEKINLSQVPIGRLLS